MKGIKLNLSLVKDDQSLVELDVGTIYEVTTYIIQGDEELPAKIDKPFIGKLTSISLSVDRREEVEIFLEFDASRDFEQRMETIDVKSIAEIVRRDLVQ